MAKNLRSKEKTPEAQEPPVQESEQGAGALPLFFQHPVPLDFSRHANAVILTDGGFSFAREANSVALMTAEFVEAAKHYPIVFAQSDLPMPVAILGLERRNYFVDDQGEWLAGTYVPAYVRKYPFVFMQAPERNQFVLCIDEKSEQFREKWVTNSLSLFEGKNPSQITRNALEFCTSFHNYYMFTRQFMEALKALDVLMPMRSNAKLSNGRQITLGGFLVIDEAKLQALPDHKVLELHKNGYLPLMYAALMSGSNWKALVDRASLYEKAD